MKNSLVSKFVLGSAVLALAAVILVSTPSSAFAYCNNGCGSSRSYPPVPTYANTGAVQVVYPNGYYYNWYVPTATYYAPIRSNGGVQVPFQYNYGTVPASNYPSAYASYGCNRGCNNW